MMKKAKQAVGELKEELHKKKLKMAYDRKQRKLEREREEAERVKQEQENLKKEYERLTLLDEKQLMVELIFAVRGFYHEMELLKEQYRDLENQIDSLDEEVAELRGKLNLSECDKE